MPIKLYVNCTWTLQDGSSTKYFLLESYIAALVHSSTTQPNESCWCARMWMSSCIELCWCPTWLWSGCAVPASNSRWQQRSGTQEAGGIAEYSTATQTPLQWWAPTVSTTLAHMSAHMRPGVSMYIHTNRRIESHGWTTNEGAAGDALMWEREIRLCSGPRSHKYRNNRLEQRRCVSVGENQIIKMKTQKEKCKAKRRDGASTNAKRRTRGDERVLVCTAQKRGNERRIWKERM